MVMGAVVHTSCTAIACPAVTTRTTASIPTTVSASLCFACIYYSFLLPSVLVLATVAVRHSRRGARCCQVYGAVFGGDECCQKVGRDLWCRIAPYTKSWGKVGLLVHGPFSPLRRLLSRHSATSQQRR